MTRCFKSSQHGAFNQKCNVIRQFEKKIFFSKSVASFKVHSSQAILEKQSKTVEGVWLCITIILKTTQRFCSSPNFESVRYSEEGRGIFRIT